MGKRPHISINQYLVHWLFLGGGLLILGCVMAWYLYSEYRALDTLERERLIAQAKVIDANLGRQLGATHRALEGIRAELPYLRKQAEPHVRITRRLNAMRDAVPGLRALTLFDADGTLTERSPDQFVGQNFSNREYYQIARQGGDPAKLYVSPPFLAATGEYVINVVKVIPDAAGNFAGILLASLNPSYFSELLDSVRYVPDMRAALAHGDGKLFLQIPAIPASEGKDLAQPGSMFSRHRDSGEKISLITGTVYATGDTRMMAQVTVRPDAVPMDKPLVLGLSRDLDSIFQPWRNDLYRNGTLFALLVLASASGLWFYQQRLRAYERLVATRDAERNRTEADLRIAAAAFESQEAMLITDANNTVLRVNQAFFKTTGYAPEEIIGKTPSLLKSGRHDAGFYREMWETLARTGSWQGEIWDRRKNGEVYPKWLTISTVRDAQGQVTHYIGTHFDITDRKLAEEKIQNLAFFDQLTGLPNRTLLLDRLGQALSASARGENFGALLFIDLDNFKTINDTQGHDIGDLLLNRSPAG